MELQDQFQTGSLHPAELCAQVIQTVWQDAFGPQFHNGNFVGNFQARLLPQRLKFLSTHVNQVLDRWYHREISLVLTFTKPTPLQVLEFQSRGQRVVSLLLQQDEILDFEDHGRDFVSFLIHDLVHASHFFTKDSAEFQRQVVFSNWMKALILNGTGEKIISQSPRAQEQFEYLISDMNTHTWHLVKTLKSLLDQWQSPDLQLAVIQILPNELKALWPLVNSPYEAEALAVQFLELMLPAKVLHGSTIDSTNLVWGPDEGNTPGPNFLNLAGL